MEIVPKQPNRFKEFLCVLFGHDWSEYGSNQCLEHNETFDEHNVCARCGLENHGIKYCVNCYNFSGKPYQRKELKYE